MIRKWIRTFGDTRGPIDNGVKNNKVPATTPIRHASNETSKDHGRSKARNKKNCNVMLRVSIVVVKGIDIGTLATRKNEKLVNEYCLNMLSPAQETYLQPIRQRGE
jgi:hypothetical protein